MEKTKKDLPTDKLKPVGSAASFDPEHGCGNDPTHIFEKLGEVKIEKGFRIPRDPKLTSAKLRERFFDAIGKPVQGFEDAFPRWIWPYIRRALLAGKLNEDLSVPDGADMRTYPLPVVAFIKKANIDFPSMKIAELPDDFLPAVKEAMDAKRMDQYGKVVDPEDMDNIPRSLWPYVRPGFWLGGIIKPGNILDPGYVFKPGNNEKPIIDFDGDFPRPLWPFI